MAKNPISMSGLKPKQQRFVAEYLVDLNASQAAVRAGYSQRNSNVVGPRLLASVGVAAAVAQGLKRLLDKPLSQAERVIAEAVRLANSDVRKLFDEGGRLKAVTDLDDDIASAVASVRVTERKLPGKDGEVEVTKELRFWDKPAALNLLAKYHKLLTEKLEVDAKVAGSVSAEDARRMNDAEIATALTKVAADAAALAKGLTR
jgi:phage terminase small subunit